MYLKCLPSQQTILLNHQRAQKELKYLFNISKTFLCFESNPLRSLKIVGFWELFPLSGLITAVGNICIRGGRYSDNEIILNVIIQNTMAISMDIRQRGQSKSPVRATLCCSKFMFSLVLDEQLIHMMLYLLSVIQQYVTCSTKI